MYGKAGIYQSKFEWFIDQPGVERFPSSQFYKVKIA
jgi:hypothetical protein